MKWRDDLIMKRKLFSLAMKKFLTFVLVLAMVLSVSSVALAAGPYPVYIGGTQVTDSNASDVLGDGKVSYDPVTNTLTLNNASIESNMARGIQVTSGGLNIELKGTNTIESVWNGIEVAGNLTISGDSNAKLTITISNDNRYAIVTTNGGDVSISNTALEISGPAIAVPSAGDINVEESNINAEAETSVFFAGADLIGDQANGGNITIKNSIIDASINDVDFGAIQALGSVKVEESQVAVESTGNGAKAIATTNMGGSPSDYDITITDSSVDATSASNSAIDSANAVKITDSAVNAEAADGGNGIKAENTNESAVSGSWVETSGENDNLGIVKDSAVIKDGTGEVIGNAVIKQDVSISQGTTLTIPAGSSLTIAQGAEVSNNGKIENNGTLTNNGTLDNSNGGTVEGTGEIINPSAPNPKPEETKSNVPGVSYECGNTFKMETSKAPTAVLVDGVSVPFSADGKTLYVNVSGGNHWMTVEWMSTTYTFNFTCNDACQIVEVAIPKTGDMPIWAAIAAVFGF